MTGLLFQIYFIEVSFQLFRLVAPSTYLTITLILSIDVTTVIPTTSPFCLPESLLLRLISEEVK